jgi:ribonuclease HII
VGHASAAEIDELGIIAALRRAGRRALAQLAVQPDVVLLDGNHDWLCDADPIQTASLFTMDHAPWPGATTGPVVRTMIKADLRCSSVAAASVLAKTTRDALMRDYARAHPSYQWQENKGYAAPEHLCALRRLGPTVLHRTSWRLPPPHAPTEPIPGLDIAWGPDALASRQ